MSSMQLFDNRCRDFKATNAVAMCNEFILDGGCVVYVSVEFSVGLNGNSVETILLQHHKKSLTMLLPSATWFTSVSTATGESLFWSESISIAASEEESSALFIRGLDSATCSRAAARPKASAEVRRNIYGGHWSSDSVPRLFWRVFDCRRRQFVDRCDLDMSTETLSSTG